LTNENGNIGEEADIQSRIFMVRGVQVMLDSDLARLFGVEVKRLNEQVRRNSERFPESFCFQLTWKEFGESQIVSVGNLKSQIATASWGGRRTRPFAFTEQGVAMLSAVLRSETAVKMSIQIINAFVAMRRFILSNAQVFQRLETLEQRQFQIDRNMEKVLNAIESKEIRPKQGIFFEGQFFDAHVFVSDLFRSAKKSIIIIDNYLDDTVLTHLVKRKENVSVLLLTRNISETLVQDVEKFNRQYPTIELREFGDSHDRFIVIDSVDIYHFGASLKDLGKKWFAFSKMETAAICMLARLEAVGGAKPE
jgi:hypothetical protein